MSVQDTLTQYRETETNEAFSLQNSKLLKVELADVTIQAKLGSMIAYQGDVKFEHAGSGGLSRMIKKAVTNEGLDLMKVSGSGEVFLADLAQEIQLVHLQDDFITANGANVLAFDAGIDWDVRRVEGVSGMLGGGLYNMELKGTGWVALVSNGTPLMLEVNGSGTYADPNAAITWSSGLKTDIKTDVNLKTLIGRSSGETVQMSFSGNGWLLVQPSEAPPKGATVASSSSSSGGGVSEGIGRFLNG